MNKKLYDPTEPTQVYNAIMEAHPPCPGAKYFTPALVAPFIPEGADPQWWCKVLRNVEYNLHNPKPKTKRRRRSNCNQPRQRSNYAEQVTRRTTTEALFS